MTATAIDFKALADLIIQQAENRMEPEDVKEFIIKLIQVTYTPVDLIPWREDDEVPDEFEGTREACDITYNLADALYEKVRPIYGKLEI